MKFHQQEATQDDVLNRFWPVGSIYLSVVNTNPAVSLGIGTWVAFGAGRCLVGVDIGDADFDAAEKTSGAKTVTLTEAQIPAHTHVQNAHAHVQQVNSASTGPLSGYTADASTNTPAASGISTQNTTAVNQNTGGGQSHPNVQPSIAIFMFKRTG